MERSLLTNIKELRRQLNVMANLTKSEKSSFKVQLKIYDMRKKV
jgi:hypothetical protein